METPTQELTEFLDRLPDAPAEAQQPPSGRLSLNAPDAPLASTDTTQWRVLPDGKFCGTGQTVLQLPAGAYRPLFDDRNGIILEQKHPLNDDIIRLPDNASSSLLTSIQMFWERREHFARRGQLFKRGILLWGPPGSGKTITIRLLTEDLIARNGIVLLVQNPHLATSALELVRKIEPQRPIICVLEDIDEILREYSEHSVLALLDGENQVGNVVHVATTNYPEYLPPRLVNRPSRFDEIIKIGLPNEEARAAYLRSRCTPTELPIAELKRWVTATNGLSIAHLRELVIAVFCLGRTYQETLLRLQAMAAKLSSEGKGLGFTK